MKRTKLFFWEFSKIVQKTKSTEYPRKVVSENDKLNKIPQNDTNQDFTSPIELCTLPKTLSFSLKKKIGKDGKCINNVEQIEYNNSTH